MRFDHLDIQFLGATKTFIEKIHTTPGMATSQSAFHNFLKLTQPISESAYPQPRVLEAGRTYEFPFIFVVPQQLLPRVCRHSVLHESVHDLHLSLPPSLGGHGDGEGLAKRVDDFAPEMANVNYHIVARLADESSRTITLKTTNVHILPRFDEQPPVNVDGPESDYHMRKEKTIRKGVFKGRLGSLVVESDQPSSIRLPHNSAMSHQAVSTSTKVRLRFDPAEKNASPPKLGNLTNKIKVSSWYADAARTMVPDKKSIQFDMHQGLHSEVLTLSSRSMEGVEWKLQTGELQPELCRRDSGLSTSSNSNKRAPSASERYQGGHFYTAEILVPITLPTDKHFVPTFHSCLVSRTYTLSLSLKTVGGAVTAPNVELKVPLQISAEGGLASSDMSPRSSLTAEEQVEEERIANEFFVPRTISPIDDGLVGNSALPGLSSDLPPDYEGLAWGGRGVETERGLSGTMIMSGLAGIAEHGTSPGVMVR